jgi:hypothetical protein
VEYRSARSSWVTGAGMGETGADELTLGEGLRRSKAPPPRPESLISIDIAPLISTSVELSGRSFSSRRLPRHNPNHGTPQAGQQRCRSN